VPTCRWFAYRDRVLTPLKPGLTLAGLARAFDRALRAAPKAVALAINSPGGSAVHRTLSTGIRQLEERYRSSPSSRTWRPRAT
jgi:hypothetical protein